MQQAHAASLEWGDQSLDHEEGDGEDLHEKW